jgi:NAD(P)-dependent dehydrogenase (short-subunit alcohol dehydrogenase family)
MVSVTPVVNYVPAEAGNFWCRLALEMAPIRFNVVSPGIIDTPTRAAMPAEARKTMLENIARTLPVKRVGLAEDVSDQVLLFPHLRQW